MLFFHFLPGIFGDVQQVIVVNRKLFIQCGGIKALIPAEACKAYLSILMEETAHFSTRVWAHLLCDSDDYAMPDLC